MPRPSWDDYYSALVRTIATRSTCNLHRAGCLVVRDHRILVTGYAGSPPGMPHCDDAGHEIENLVCVRAIHAELNAISDAAARGVELAGAILYCTVTPCPECAKAIVMARISRVVCTEDSAEARSQELFAAAGVKLVILPPSTGQGGDHGS